MLSTPEGFLTIEQKVSHGSGRWWMTLFQIWRRRSRNKTLKGYQADHRGHQGHRDCQSHRDHQGHKGQRGHREPCGSLLHSYNIIISNKHSSLNRPLSNRVDHMAVLQYCNNHALNHVTSRAALHICVLLPPMWHPNPTLIGTHFKIHRWHA